MSMDFAVETRFGNSVSDLQHWMIRIWIGRHAMRTFGIVDILPLLYSWMYLLLHVCGAMVYFSSIPSLPPMHGRLHSRYL